MTTNKPNWILAAGIPFCIFLACFSITFTSAFTLNKTLVSNAILVDLLITAPLAYFFITRKTSVSILSVARVFMIGVLVAGLILNSHSSMLLHIIKVWISPAIEGLLIFFVARKFYLANSIAKQNNSRVDFLMHCRRMMQELIGNEKIAAVISSEIAVFYYAFIGKKPIEINHQTSFSSYKENGILLVLSAILGLFIIETTGMHFVIQLWSNTVAWVLTGLSVYTCLQLFAHIRAVKARPIMLQNDCLAIHNGLAGDAFIELANIQKIACTNKLPQHNGYVKIALLKGLENHNLIVHLKTPIQVTKIFGIKKTTATVLFFVDKAPEFLQAVKAKLSNMNTIG